MHIPLASWNPSQQRVESLLRWAVAGVAGLCAILSPLLLWRRLGGAFDQPLRGDVVCGVTLLAILGSAAWRTAAQVVFPCERRDCFAVLVLLPSLCLLPLLMALTLPNSPWWSLSLLWLLIPASEAFWWWRLKRRPGGQIRTSGSQSDLSESLADLSKTRSAQREDEEEHEAYDPRFSTQHVTQQWTRAAGTAGAESLHGVFRERFGKGERLRQVHVAICPPLAHPPEVDVYQTEGPEASIKVAQRETFGLRFEVRLADPPANEEWITLEFLARGNQAFDDEQTVVGRAKQRSADRLHPSNTQLWEL